mmetsp:Transcript_34588/g.72787  ORF Transcript_34588/g.72787 Transcript_34588/m.72787 type:complete len:266 (-) Transcript_34588:129-926(-)
MHAAYGMVSSQAAQILRRTFIFNPASPSPVNFLPSPTPMTEPTMHSEVETGSASSVADVSATTVPICAAKARDGVMSVILEPTVTITFDPSVRSPRTKAETPSNSGHGSSAPTALPAAVLPLAASTVATICISGPAALETSCAPCTKATESAERMRSGPKCSSTSRSWPSRACAWRDISLLETPPSSAPKRSCSSDSASLKDASGASASCPALVLTARSQRSTCDEKAAKMRPMSEEMSTAVPVPTCICGDFVSTNGKQAWKESK